MRWPEPGVLPQVARQDIPVGTQILGMAPMGVRWYGTVTKRGIRPDEGCPVGEFSPCFANLAGGLKEIR